MNRQPPELTPEMLQQHPELMVAWIFVLGLLMFYLVGAVISWVYLGTRLYQGQPLLGVDPWRPRAWGFLDVVLVAVAAVVGQTLALLAGSLIMGQDPRNLAGNGGMTLTLAFLSGLGNLLAMIMIVVWISLRFGVGPGHAGFVAKGLPRHLLVGLMVGLAMLPVVYLMMFVVSIGLNTQYAHPLLDQVTKDRTLTAYLLGVAAAAIFAPLTEEFLFRVIIQGWLQSLPFKTAAANVVGALPTWMRPLSNSAAAADRGQGPGYGDIAAAHHSNGTHSVEPQHLEQSSDLQRSVNPDAGEVDGEEVIEASVVHAGNPYATPGPDTAAAGAVSRDDAGLQSSNGVAEPVLVPPVWPSVVTGILFGLAHWGYGLSFIPLIAMGIVLGLVYRATHSIWPCVLIHGMLNSTSMLMLGVMILQQNAAGTAS
jgi:membrane protease YdiL (CAAX protease family)